MSNSEVGRAANVRHIAQKQVREVDKCDAAPAFLNYVLPSVYRMQSCQSGLDFEQLSSFYRAGRSSKIEIFSK